jgi:hypothetical protein
MAKKDRKKKKATPANFKNRGEKKPSKNDSLKCDPKNRQLALKEKDNRPDTDIMSKVFGTKDEGLQNYLMDQLVHTFNGYASVNGCDKTKTVEFLKKALIILHGIQPQDEVEGLLAVQMVGVHNMAMETMSRAMLRGQTFEGKDINIKQATKMLRTFIAQIEALKRYRTGGQQKMVIEHVHVNEGGQAIVGQVNEGGGKNKNCE